MKTGGDAMGGETEGRQRVWQLLLDPLSEMGMVRRSGFTVEKHKAMLSRIADKLAYMSADNLTGLAEYLPRLAGGGANAVWPSEASILRDAYNLQTPPPRDSDYARSLVRSEMGRAAMDGGYLVELFQIAKRLGPPPAKYVIFKLREEAQQNRGKRRRIGELIEAGKARPDEIKWLEQYHADLTEAESIIKARKETA